MVEKELKGLCLKCTKYIPHFKVCADNPLFVFSVDEPPEEHICHREFADAGRRNPYKQMSLQMVDDIHKTHFEFTFDPEYWIRDVKVKGMPDATLELDIPKELVVFSFYNTETPKLRYKIDPTLPSVVVCSELMRPLMTTRVKTWNNYPRDVSAIPAIAFPLILQKLSEVVRTLFTQKGNFQSLEMNWLTADGFEEFMRYWKNMGYEGGEIEIDGVTIPYFTYKKGVTYNRIYVSNLTSHRFFDEVMTRIVPTETGDRHTLEKFGLDNHCPLCGYAYDNPLIVQPCQFCHRNITPVVGEASPIVFK